MDTRLRRAYRADLPESAASDATLPGDRASSWGGRRCRGVARVARRRGGAYHTGRLVDLGRAQSTPRSPVYATRPDAGGGRPLRGGKMKLAHAMVAAAGTATIALAGPASPAFAAAPSNDTMGGATGISAVPFSETIDTSEATTDAPPPATHSTSHPP